MERNSCQYWNSFYSGCSNTKEDDRYDNWLNNYKAYFKPGISVLDLGCGLGINLPALLGFGASVVAADFSETAIKAIDISFPKETLQTLCFDMKESFPLLEDTFDIIVADLSLHYFGNKDMQHIIGELKRVLKQNGMLIARVHSINQARPFGKVEIESGFYYCDGCCRKYFTKEEIQTLFSCWALVNLKEKSIYRYGQEKKIFEFAVINNSKRCFEG